MLGKSLKEHSKSSWAAIDDSPSIEQLQFGALQRIADATEAMAQNYVLLQADRDYYRAECRRLEDEIQHLKNSRAGYMAHLTRLRRKQNV